VPNEKYGLPTKINGEEGPNVLYGSITDNETHKNRVKITISKNTVEILSNMYIY
jgi:hypothetical protein